MSAMGQVFYEVAAKPETKLAAVCPASGGLRPIVPDLQLVRLPVGDSIYEINSPVTHLYFPIDCIAANLHKLKDGAPVTTSGTGREGMLGISYVLGS
jgi:hypothetical protein